MSEEILPGLYAKECETCCDTGFLCGICGVAQGLCEQFKHETSLIDCPNCDYHKN